MYMLESGISNYGENILKFIPKIAGLGMVLALSLSLSLSPSLS
jgi:hypothetical protein